MNILSKYNKHVQSFIKRNQRWVKVIGIALAVFLIFYTGYRYREYQQLRNDPEFAATKEINEIIKYLSGFMVLPADDYPTMATVTEAEKVNNQEFLRLAENGDKLLLFTKSKKAILYRPGTRKIIEFGSLMVNQKQ